MCPLHVHAHTGADLFDILSIIYNRGLTGLNWQGMLLHHIVSVIMLGGAVLWGVDPNIAAQAGILLDGTGKACMQSIETMCGSCAHM